MFAHIAIQQATHFEFLRFALLTLNVDIYGSVGRWVDLLLLARSRILSTVQTVYKYE